MQAVGGDGANGGAGGRIAGKANLIQFVGRFETQGGAATEGEAGAAGTMLLTNNFQDDLKTLRIYNREGAGVSAVTYY